MTKRYWIRDATCGVAFEDATTPRDALLAFVASRVAGELRPLIEVGDDGSASVTYGGSTYTAVPVPPDDP